MSLDQDVENAQTDKIKNRKVILIAALVAAAVILMAACGAFYFNSKSFKNENSPLGSAAGPALASVSATEQEQEVIPGPAFSSLTVPEVVPAPASEPEIYSQGEVFVISKKFGEPVVLFNSETGAEVPFTGQNRVGESYHNAQVSPDGKVIGVLSRTIKKSGTRTFFSLSIRLAGRDGKFWKELELPQLNNFTNFSFTPDSKRIVYTPNNKKQIASFDLNGENLQILLDFPQSNELIYFSALLKNGALVYSVKIGNSFKVCMKKGGAEKSCWDNKFTTLLTLIPFGQFVYCLEIDGKVSRIDTNSDPKIKTKLESFTIDGISWCISNGIISENGEFLYLSAPVIGKIGLFMFKVNIEKALSIGTYQIENPVPSFAVPFIALVPNLREL